MSGLAAFGTALKMGDGATPTEAFADIANVTNISGPGFSLDVEDVTAHDSVEGWEEVVPTIKRSGEVTLDINYDPEEGTHDPSTGLLSKFEDKSLTNWKIVFPVGTPAVEWAFSAFVTGFEAEMPFDGKISASVTLKLSGAPTLA